MGVKRRRIEPRRPGGRIRLTAGERLEPRHALAVSFGGGTWTIVGDADAGLPDDTIVVEPNPANARQLRALVNGVVVDVRSAARVKTIHVMAGAGDDSVAVNLPGNARIATRLEGGFGNDVISGGEGRDVILGGPGRDTLNGRGGDDEIRGNGGMDSLVGSAGDDDLHGGAGVDVLRGGAGRNALDGGLAVDAIFGTAGRDVARLDDGERLVGNETTNPLAPVGDVARLKSWATEAAVARARDLFGRPVGPWWAGPIIPQGEGPGDMATTAGPVATDFSPTPTQVAGVDEGDRVKTNGSQLFVIAGDGVDIVDVSVPQRLGVLAHLPLPGHERQLFLSGSRLTVISQEWEAWGEPLDAVGRAAVGAVGTAAMMAMPAPTSWQVVVTVVDVANPAAPAVLETTRLDGWLLDARAIGDRVVVVTQDALDLPAVGVIGAPSALMDSASLPGATGPILPTVIGPPGPVDAPAGWYESEVDYRARLDRSWTATLLPGYRVVDARGGQSAGTLVDPARTSLPVDGGDTSLLSVVSFTVGDDQVGPDAATTAGGIGGRVYASTSCLVVYDTHVGAWWDEADAATTTNIYRFDLTTAAAPLVAMGSVPGVTLDQFSLDEHDGLLRIATTSGFGDGASSGVTVLAAAAGRLEAVGRVVGLARGERIYSVRFAGARGYVSTFREVDPLFVIDLSVPTDPRVTGELKVPGYSTHLVPLDGRALLGIGRDVDATTGRDGGLQLSIFDVGDPAAPRRSATFTFAGDWASWSPAAWDHHALGWFSAQGILALPVQEGAEATELVVFRVDPDSAAAFRRLGDVSHPESIDRSVRVGDVLYAVSTGRITAHPLADPAVQLAAVDLTAADGGPIIVAF